MAGYGARLKAARKACGFSLDALAADIGSNKAVISRAENELRPPTLAEAVRLSEALGYRLGWLILGEPPAKGHAVAVLVEDDSPTARHVRRQISAELTGSAEPARKTRRNVRDVAD
jgi:transcriptional regulator with XRE-family HTH domain